MQAIAQPVSYRISRTKEAVMISVALVLDVAPLALVGLAIALVFNALAGSSCKEIISDMDGTVLNTIWTVVKNPIDAMRCGGTLVFSGLGGIMVGPALYLVATLAISIIAFLLYPAWFFLSGGYIMVSFTHMGKMMTNLVSFILAGMFKYFPVLNLFPMPVYAVTVWRHCQISRKEDREKSASSLVNKETPPRRARGVGRVVSGNARRSRYGQRDELSPARPTAAVAR